MGGFRRKLHVSYRVCTVLTTMAGFDANFLLCTHLGVREGVRVGHLSGAQVVPAYHSLCPMYLLPPPLPFRNPLLQFFLQNMVAAHQPFCLAGFDLNQAPGLVTESDMEG